MSVEPSTSTAPTTRGHAVVLVHADVALVPSPSGTPKQPTVSRRPSPDSVSVGSHGDAIGAVHGYIWSVPGFSAAMGKRTVFTTACARRSNSCTHTGCVPTLLAVPLPTLSSMREPEAKIGAANVDDAV